jgi:hypothetical protein
MSSKNARENDTEWVKNCLFMRIWKVEGGMCNVKPKANHKELVMSFMSENKIFDNVYLHVNLMIVGMEINFGK